MRKIRYLFSLVSNWILDAGYWILDTGYWMLDTGYWILDAGYWILDAGYWMLDTGCWMLDAGYWMLDAGCWILEASLIRDFQVSLSWVRDRNDTVGEFGVAIRSGLENPDQKPKSIYPNMKITLVRYLLSIEGGVRLMKNCLKIISGLLLFLSIAILLEAEAFGSIFADPNVPDGEQYIWRATMPDEEPFSSVVTWRVSSGEGRPMYVITTDAGQRKQGEYIIDRSDLRLIGINVTEKTRDGKFEIAIAVRNGRQYMVSEFKNKTKQKDIKHISDGYNGVILPFYLRGFPFGEKKEVKLKITVPILPGKKLWVWKMWKSTVKLLGEETITVPAGTFDCYKLEVSASNWAIKRVTSKYYFWYTKGPPHRFVKFRDKDGKNMTELMEILCTGEE